MLSRLCSADISPFLNQSGTLIPNATPDQVIPIVVEEVAENPRAMPRRHKPDRRIPFSILLSSGKDVPPFQDGLCTFSLGEFSVADIYVVHIVPQSEEEDREWYQIVLN
ncbi:DUF6916 family protein [Candidatus Magnetaquicoccus inordinatus]|uniref:DUF6916 family protein n=1 Tax=Candidatus Magnetaquicoccus inordinatus TaxID=2496818 RepID=UPI00102CA0D5|nr:hypothetical protein [Candidatus Magnetaquicoccus inordinatus]